MQRLKHAKKWINATILGLICFAPFDFTSKAKADSITFKGCYNITHEAPFYLGEGNRLPPKGKRGMIIDAIDNSAEELTVKIDWVRSPWKRCLHGLKMGRYDFISSALYTKERSTFAQYPQLGDDQLDNSRALGRVHFHFYENKNNPIGWSGHDKFYKKRLIVHIPRGFVVADKLNELNIPFIMSKSPLHGFESLAAEKIDSYIFSREVYEPMIEKSDRLKATVQRVDPAFLTADLYIPFNKNSYQKNTKLVERFWTTLSKRFKQKHKQYLAYKKRTLKE